MRQTNRGKPIDLCNTGARVFKLMVSIPMVCIRPYCFSLCQTVWCETFTKLRIKMEPQGHSESLQKISSVGKEEVDCS
ncbi:hypothetical protein IscW_ISCW012861 [Ixodes scapularis]|uniref:Uncharacterized protein n=1 Tax=Ixodes scapularis TaxID=6945 RepID=B7QCT2_IXOSC|nr:hypothetical protein IscW_ISCW012861 [Ixodes scapularis]|eukprot:XP_002413346.1 hypothetical protein IscW_ISCW012861 [Ixodes scapularis]